MKANRLIKISATVLSVLMSMQIYAQDPHLSQYDASAIITNPSLSGMINREDMRAVTQFRNQWDILGSRFTSTSLAFDAPIDKQLGAGMYLVDDDAAKAFGTFSIVMTGAYQINSPLQRKYKMCVGLGAGFIYKRTKDNKLLFDNQYSNGVFNENLPSGEVFPDMSLVMPEVTFGVSYLNIDDSKKLNPYGGLTVFHITNPKESFYGTKSSRLPMRFLITGGTKISPNERIIIDPSILLMKQANNYEFIINLRAKYRVNTKVAAAAGIAYRFRDAIIPTLGFDYNSYVFRVSYDITVSELRKYTHYKGGLEFSLLFIGSSSRATSKF